MAIATFTSDEHGFGITYDAARFACVARPGVPRLAAARWSRLPVDVVFSVLVTEATASATEVAAARAPWALIATDDAPVGPASLSPWDWDAVTERESRSFSAVTGAADVEVRQLYWRGFPVLQLATDPSAGAPPAHSLELLGMLYTPAQTFAALAVGPWEDAANLVRMFQEIMDGFFLVPLEREGRARTRHQYVQHFSVRHPERQGEIAGG